MIKSYEVVRIVHSIAKKKVEVDSSRWPPLCTGILHQPKRPTKQRFNHEELHTEKKISNI